MVTMERKTSDGVFTVTVTMDAGNASLTLTLLRDRLHELANIHREAAASVDELSRTLAAVAESWLRPSSR